MSESDVHPMQSHLLSEPGTHTAHGDRSPEERARTRRRQWRAIAGALLLISWNGVPEAPADTVDVSLYSADAAEIRALQRDGIIAKLQERNGRLGEIRASRIADAVLRCTDSQQLKDLTPRLVLSVMFQESDAKPHAISPKGAIGLMQVMPYTYELLDLPGGIANLESNVEAGCLVLADNMRRLGREKGISSYFWGSHIRGDAYLNGVETILRTLSVESPLPKPGRG